MIPGSRRAWCAAAAAVSAVCVLPFLQGLLLGHSFYFRDLARQFLPTRVFVLEGLRHGQLRFWNPYNHEGIPLPFVPIGYPLELLHLLWPTEPGISFFLALHVPLAACGFILLARHLGLPPVAAAGGALVYALGGFALSTLNFYVYLHALAWAPVAVWALLRAGDGMRRAVPLAALVLGLAWSTAGVEIVAQAVAVGVVLAWRADPRRAWRLGAAVALSLGLAAPVLLTMSGLTAGTARATGFISDVVLNQSVHPFTFVQAVVGQLYGELGRGPDRWWGVNFFERGFPYILSLYLGAAVLALAGGGLAGERPGRLRLVLVALVAVVICLGRFAGWAAVVDHLPPALRAFRFPSKAFFTVHLVVALLSAWGLEALATGHRRGRAVVAALALGAGGLLSLAPALPWLAPRGTAWFLARFFSQTLAPAARVQIFDGITVDAALGGGVAVALGLLALGARSGTEGGRRLALLAAGLVAGDLLRTGAGLNPMIEPGFFRQSLPVAEALAALRPTRIHTCEPTRAAAYWRGRSARPGRHELYSFAVWRDTLAPHYNLTMHVASALSEDTTSLVPLGRVPPADFSCARLDAAVPLLRDAGVTHVVSLDPLSSPMLTEAAAAASPAAAPDAVHFYALADARPRVSVEPFGTATIVRDEPDHVLLEVDAPSPGRLVLRDGWAAGWTARVAGGAAVVDEHAGRHRAVAVPAGRSLVEMSYRAPGWRTGLWVMAATAILLLLLAAAEGRRQGRFPKIDSFARWKTNSGFSTT
jgi:hypothetical protein